jgi:hypothetical protein
VGVGRCGGLDEGDVAVDADAEYLQVDTTGFLDFSFIFLAMGFDPILGDKAVGQMIIPGIDIGMLKQVFAHERVVTLQRVIVHRIILVKVERNHIFETQSLFPVHPYQFGI